MTPAPYPSTVPAGAEQPIYDAMPAAVQDQRLAPGTKLVEARLTELFGVSRTIVRMALLRLAHERVVQLQPNRGASIAAPGITEMHDVFEARRVVQCGAMPIVAARASQRALSDLRKLVRQEDAAFQAGDVKGWIRLSGEFHTRLVALAGNAALQDYASELVTRSLLMTALYMPPGQTACATGEHLSLIDALANGDGRRAARMMDAHLRACEARLELRRAGKPAVELAEALGVKTRAVGAA
jgi:DNA-binding GntR family transcriptional regulator